MFSHQNIHKYTWNSPEYFSNNLTLMIIYLQNSKCENTMLLKNYVNVDISLKLKIVNYSHQNSIILYSAKQSTVSCHCCSNSWILLYIHTHTHIYIYIYIYKVAPAGLPLGKTRYALYRRLGRLQGQCGRVRKIPPTRIRSPDIPPHTESLLSAVSRPTYIYIYVYIPV